MHFTLLCQALAGISPATTNLEQFQSAAGIEGRTVARSTIDFLAKSSVGRISKEGLTFSSSDRLKAAILSLRFAGCDANKVARQLSWKDFEHLAAEILDSCGYKTRTNVRLVKPSMEIDVVGINSGLALMVDCKHWKRNNISAIANYARKQAARTSRLVVLDAGIKGAVPVILTLEAESVRFVEGIPVVPIAQFRSFVLEVQSYLAQVCVITRT